MTKHKEDLVTYPKLLDGGRHLTLRPMQRPKYWDFYQKARKNHWSVEELDFSKDRQQLAAGAFTPAQLHMIKRLVAFFATGDEVVNDNVCLNLYRHVNSPEYRAYVTRQAEEETVHVDAYLRLLDIYLETDRERQEAFEAIDNVPSIKAKAEFCFRRMDSGTKLLKLETDDDRKAFLLSVLSFGLAVEGMFFIAAFAYIYFLRSKGLAQGFADLNDWVARDESMHMTVALELARDIITEYPHLWTEATQNEVRVMMREARDLEVAFAADLLSEQVSGLTLKDMTQYIEFTADQRLVAIGLKPEYKVGNPFPWMINQGLQLNTNFFEARTTNYQQDLAGKFSLDEEF